MAGRFTGQSVERIEDTRLLRGRGRFVGGAYRRGLRHVVFVRSPQAHAQITGVDAGAARAVPGVEAVVTAEDLAGVLAAPMAMVGPPGLSTAPFWPLARDKVRHVGDPVAMVVADDPVVAADAAELVEVSYEPLAPVVDVASAADPASAALWEELGTNVAYEGHESWGPVSEVFDAAHRVVTRRFAQHRVSHVPLEPRAAVAEFEPATATLTYEASHKRPHLLKMTIAALLGMAFPDIRVIAGDIGGGFGSKGQVTREDVALCAAAKLLGCPLRWVETRTENLMVAGHAREEELEVAMAADADGRVRGLSIRMDLDSGAYPMLPFPASFFATLVKLLAPNAYRFEAYEFAARVLYTNKASYISYRGPWAAETWVREAMFDAVARELGLTPEDVRRANLVLDHHQPTPMITGASLSGITASQTLERALELADVASFREAQARARTEGRYLGFGFATFIELAPGPPDFAGLVGFDLPSETAWARIEPTGHVTLTTWQVSQGQSHETTLAQVVADEMGVPLEQVRVRYGDSAASPFTTLSTGGSRAATMATGSALGAARIVKDMALSIAASMLEAAEADLEIVDGEVRVRGTPTRSVPLTQVAQAAWFAPSSLPEGLRQGLEATCDFRVPEGGWASATHCCWVEVDPETGVVTVPRFLVVEDCGTMINPAVVEGQIAGGVAQGLAAALYERHVYDADGQLVTANLADYLVPSAADLPPVEIDHLEHLPPVAGGDGVHARGVGEGGMIGAPAALCNAVSDALAPFGVEVSAQSLAPEAVRALVAGAPGALTPAGRPRSSPGA